MRRWRERRGKGVQAKGLKKRKTVSRYRHELPRRAIAKRKQQRASLRWQKEEDHILKAKRGGRKSPCYSTIIGGMQRHGMGKKKETVALDREKEEKGKAI